MEGVKTLQHKYNANIYISQLPPRRVHHNDTVNEVNRLIENGATESIHVILQKDLTANHLYDEKHILIKHMGMYLKPMKDKIKEVLGVTNTINHQMIIQSFHQETDH